MSSLLAAVPVRYCVFDLLSLDGQPATELPYEQRRAMLTGPGFSAMSAHRSKKA